MRRTVTLLTLFCLVLGALAGSAVAAGKGVSYSGKTAQKRAVKLKVRGSHMNLLNFTIELKCHDGSVLIDQESGFEAAPLRGGSFSETQYGSTDKVTFQGRVHGARTTGTLKVTDKVGKVRCVSPKVKFTAHRK